MTKPPKGGGEGPRERTRPKPGIEDERVFLATPKEDQPEEEPLGRIVPSAPGFVRDAPPAEEPGFFTQKGVGLLNGKRNWDRGSYVRSYDFEHRRDCWVEGVVTGFVTYGGVPRYLIDVERRSVEGRPVEVHRPWVVMPVANGVQYALGDLE